MKTIIIPTDFSPAATNALHYGIELAKAINGELLLFHVYQVPVSYSDVPLVMVSVDELTSAAKGRLENLKKEVEHITSGEIKIGTKAVMGNVTDELERVCHDLDPFAVVMSSRDASGIERVLFGSNTLSAIRHLTTPVICVPPGRNYGTGIKKIGLACDLKDTNETIPVEMIRNMVKEFNAELHVLNVDHHNKHFTPETPEEATRMHGLLEDMKPVYHFIEHKDIEDGIMEFAELNNLDLVITIPKKHKLLEGIFSPGSTRQLVAHSHVPVMCVHE